jgi:flagellar capping protein FliD
MATVNLTGLSTGIDTAAIVQQLMQVESRQLTLMQNKLAGYKDKKTAMTELESKVGTFKTALSNIYSLSKLKAFDTSAGTTSSGKTVLTASASASATEGSHSVQIKQLATAERLVHSGEGFSSVSSLVGAGTLAEATAILKKEYHSKDRLWASWGDYDRRQFERECKEKELSFPFGLGHLNVKTLFAVAQGLDRELGMGEAYQRLGWPIEGVHHHGDDDAWNIAGVLCMLLKRMRD